MFNALKVSRKLSPFHFDRVVVIVSKNGVRFGITGKSLRDRTIYWSYQYAMNIVYPLSMSTALSPKSSQAYVKRIGTFLNIIS